MDKEINKIIIIVIALTGFLGGLAKALDEENCHTNWNWKNVIVQSIVGGVSGLIFGSIACYLFGEAIYIVMPVAGAGGVLGMKGARSLAESIKRIIEISLTKK